MLRINKKCSKFALTISFVLSISSSIHAQTYTTCDSEAFYSALGQSESGGCGAGNQYNCVGPVITSGMHEGDTPLGKYQFMPKTLAGMGISTNGFVGNAALQDQAIKQFTAGNDKCLESKGAYDYIGTVRNGVTLTRSGLLGAAHLGGCGGAAKWAKGGTGPSDQLGTSLADYSAKFSGYGMFGDVAGGSCGGGVANAAGLFAEAQAKGLHDMLACDPTIFEKNQTTIEAVKQLNAEISKSIITQPTAIEQLTCADQQQALLSEAGGIHSNVIDGDLNSSTNEFTNLAKNPVMQTINNALTSVSGISSSINTLLNTTFGDLQGNFLSSLSGSSPASTSTNCDMIEQAWLINQCIETPTMPSLSSIIGGELAEITGAATKASSITNPERMLEQVCKQANSLISGLSSNVNNAFEKAANESTQPITDTLGAFQ